jgi:hypothetical protein
MPGKPQSYSDAVLNVLRGTSITGVSPYLGLFSVAPADDSSAGTELAGNGYRWHLDLGIEYPHLGLLSAPYVKVECYVDSSVADTNTGSAFGQNRHGDRLRLAGIEFAGIGDHPNDLSEAIENFDGRMDRGLRCVVENDRAKVVLPIDQAGSSR